MFDEIHSNDRIFALKVRSRTSHGGSSCSRSGRCSTRDGNLSCIFCLKNNMYDTNELERGNGVEHSPQNICAECSTRWPSAQYLRSIIQRNYHLLVNKVKSARFLRCT